MIVRVPKKVLNPGPIKGPGNKPLRGRKRKGYALFHDFFPEYRALGLMKNDTLYRFWIGAHDGYERQISLRSW